MAETVARMSGSSSTTSTVTSRISGGLHDLAALLGTRHRPAGRILVADDCRCDDGDRHREDAATLRSWLHPDASLVRIHDAPADVEAKTDAGFWHALHVRGAVEAIEDPLALVLGHTDAVVAHRDPRRAALDRELDLGQDPAGAVLDRVLDEVVDHLLEARRVDRADHRLARDRYLQGDALVVVPAAHRLDHGAQVDRLEIHHLGALLQPLRIEQL